MELLAYLVLHPGIRVPRAVLAGTFWPETSQPQAMTNLRRELYNLRRLLGDIAVLEVSDGAIGVLPRAGLGVDVQLFSAERTAALQALAADDPAGFLAHARAALRQYRGDLMPGNYSDWVPEPRQRLLRECTDLCDQLVSVLTVQGQGQAALEVAGRRVAIAPLEEPGHRSLIRAHLALGDRPGALQAFHRCTEVLERELGVAPAAETGRLVGSGPAPPTLRFPSRSTCPHGGRTPIGRQREMEVLRHCWQDACAGASGLLVLTGDPGVGKTHLAAALGDLVGSTGAVVARARCVDSAGSIPLAPVAAWLRSREIVTARDTLPDTLRREVARLLPDLPGTAEAPETAGPPGTGRAMVDAWQRNRFFEALAASVAAVGRPTLLLLDDLQWCDADTAAWLAFLLGSGRCTNLLLAATLRSAGTADAPPISGLLEGARSAGLLRELAVEPLGAVAGAELAGRLRGRRLNDAEALLLHAATGGYPLHILEAAHARAQDGFGTILGSRLRRLGPQSLHVAELAAALGRDISLDLLSEAADLDTTELIAAIDELWRLGILRPVGTGYDFGHQLLRDAVYRQATPAGRWLLHRRLAQGLESLYAGNLDAVAATLAEQYARGSSPARALPFHLRAGADAARVFANSAALHSYGQALEIIAARHPGSDRDEAELAVRRSLSPPQTALLGYSSAALISNLERIGELAGSLGRSDVRSGSLIGLFAARFVQGRTADSYAVARQGLELAGTDTDLLGQGHFAVAGAAQGLGRTAESIAHFTRCLQTPHEGFSFILGTRLEIHAMGWAAHAHLLAGDEAGAVHLGAEALAASRAGGHIYTRAVALAYAAVLAQLRGDEALGPLVTELLGLCRRYDIAYYRQWGEILAGRLAGGRDGTARIRAGIAVLRAQDSPARMPYWLSLLASNLADAGDGRGACAVLDSARAVAQLNGETWWLPEVLRLRADQAHGSEPEALLAEAGALATEQGSRFLLDRLAGGPGRTPDERGPA